MNSRHVFYHPIISLQMIQNKYKLLLLLRFNLYNVELQVMLTVYKNRYYEGKILSEFHYILFI